MAYKTTKFVNKSTKNFKKLNFVIRPQIFQIKNWTYQTLKSELMYHKRLIIFNRNYFLTVKTFCCQIVSVYFKHFMLHKQRFLFGRKFAVEFYAFVGLSILNQEFKNLIHVAYICHFMALIIHIFGKYYLVKIFHIYVMYIPHQSLIDYIV